MRIAYILLITFIAVFFAACNTSKKISPVQFEEDDTAGSVVRIVVQRRVYDKLQTKYSAVLNVHPDSIENLKLYQFVDRWLDVPYKWGGIDERGIDCSAFLQRLLYDVYDIGIPRTSIEQFFTNKIEPFSSVKYLSEGDLVFFRTIRNTYVSHVGLYLKNKMFINASSSRGVSIGNLDDPYWKGKFVAAGRIRSSKFVTRNK